VDAAVIATAATTGAAAEPARPNHTAAHGADHAAGAGTIARLQVGVQIGLPSSANGAPPPQTTQAVVVAGAGHLTGTEAAAIGGRGADRARVPVGGLHLGRTAEDIGRNPTAGGRNIEQGAQASLPTDREVDPTAGPDPHPLAPAHRPNHPGTASYRPRRVPGTPNTRLRYHRPCRSRYRHRSPRNKPSAWGFRCRHRRRQTIRAHGRPPLRSSHSSRTFLRLAGTRCRHLRFPVTDGLCLRRRRRRRHRHRQIRVTGRISRDREVRDTMGVMGEVGGGRGLGGHT
jgi:hypothetical protein